MHELSVCQSLLRQVARIAQERGATRVTAVTVRIGPLSGVEADLLQTAYLQACQGTLAAQAKLIIERAPVRVRCGECGSESEALPNRLCCGHCTAGDTTLISGTECLLVSIELMADHES